MREPSPSMTCRDLPRVLAGVLGNEATPTEQELLRNHTDRCPGCAGGLAAVSLAIARAHEAEVPEPGPDYWTDFLPALRRRLERVPPTTPARRLRGWLLPLTLTSAMVAATALLLLTGHETRVRPRPQLATLEDVQRLATSLDRMPVEDPLSWLEPGPTASAGGPQTPPDLELTGDLFAFYDLATQLSAEERDEAFALVAEPERAPSAG